MTTDIAIRLRIACASGCLLVAALGAPAALADDAATRNSAKAAALPALMPQVRHGQALASSSARQTGRLDATPTSKRWQPGDGIRFVPKRMRPVQPLPAPANPTTWTIDPLLEVQARAQASAPLRGPGAPLVNIFGNLFTGAFPPDTVGDVGAAHYVQAVNASGGTAITVWDKAGNLDFGPATLSSIGSGVCADGLGDPIVLYDELADRWLLSEFSAVADALCVYVSQSGDPGGFYNAYIFNTPNFPDYPKYAVWPDRYTVTSNESGPPAIYSLPRAAMLAGSPAAATRFTVPSLAGFGFQALTPVDFDGPPPPAGAPAYFVRHRDDEVHNAGSNNPNADFIELWELAGSTLTGPQNIAVTEFDSDLCGLFSFNCFPQPNGQRLDPLREVVMWRAQYRNFGRVETIVGNLVTDVTGTDRGGVRWFELRNDGGGWSLFQEGTYAPDTDNRWMGSIAMDQTGNIALGYSVVGPSQPTDIRYAGRLISDQAGTLPAGELTLAAGSASQSAERWGDYSSMNVDPVDECTFWYTNEYVTATNRWDTRIGAFRFPQCGPAVCGDGLPNPAEECDDGNTGDGDGCSANCTVEPGFTCTDATFSQPSVCSGAGDVCFAEDFEAGLGGWSVFNVGPLNFDWGTTDDFVCFSNNLSSPGVPPAPNVTGGAGEAACIDTDAAGFGLVEAYLCSPPFAAGSGQIDLSFAYNYRIFDATGEDFLGVFVGTAPPAPATIGGYVQEFATTVDGGGFAALPGVLESVDLTAYAGSDIHICFGYGGDFDWYAQVDEVSVSASDGCAPAPDTDQDGVPDDADNCLVRSNPAQDDSNGDGIGNVCDPDIGGLAGPGLDDCDVNFTDLGILKTAFFSTPASPNWNPDADFTGSPTGEPDGAVGFPDLGRMKEFFFGGPGPSGVPNGCP